MSRHGLSALALAVLLSGGAAAGGATPPASWLGQRVDVAQTAFCRAQGCALVEVRENSFNTPGWHDGTKRTYRLRGGERLEVDVRPGGWISNVFLLKDGARLGSSLTLRERRLAAEFLTLATGRRFPSQAVAQCVAAGLTAQRRNPDVYGPDQPLSQWSTPAGLPYKARCGVAGAGPLGVWAGWMQQ
ncbi:hypothetical protein [Deinococcus budaensis]|uniref:Uncharacterized protein n=1 Tax=Deinococcus budaensis TaxID=1665626 RepID=A0A7W8GD78_9DEIO|nr:hypothetical protein [Deinococcus budaensis]MBB5233353.1 hypothetical protein [Deinococcus budaensis]